MAYSVQKDAAHNNGVYKTADYTIKKNKTGVRITEKSTRNVVPM